MLDWLLNFINSFFSTLWELILVFLDGFMLMLGYLLYSLFDGFLISVHAFMVAIDFSEVAFNYGAKYSHLPPQLVYLCGAVDLPQMFAYITGAIVVRMLLNLIPASLSRV